MKTRMIPLCMAALMLGGCGSITGLSDSSSKFACKAPDGIACTSVSGVYANVQQNNVPGLQQRPRPRDSGAPAPPGAAMFPMMAAGMPIRSQARQLRIWVAPWRDDDDTLHDQSFMYVMVDPGRWLVERSREATVQRTMTRLKPLGKPRTADAQQEHSTTLQLARVRTKADAQAAARDAARLPADAEETK